MVSDREDLLDAGIAVVTGGDGPQFWAPLISRSHFQSLPMSGTTTASSFSSLMPLVWL